MLCPEGNLLHIDFGFILGRDPKPVPRGPFRLSAAMVDGLGGREHPNFAAFKRLCVQVRKEARRMNDAAVVGVPPMSLLSK